MIYYVEISVQHEGFSYWLSPKVSFTKKIESNLSERLFLALIKQSLNKTLNELEDK